MALPKLLQARLVLAATAGALVWFLAAAFMPAPPAAPPAQGGNDLRLYGRIVERVHAGESYYDAAGAELRADGYPTGSVFNWRTPLYAWFLGSLPDAEWGRFLLIAAAVGTLLLAYGALAQQGGPQQAVPGVLLLVGVFLWCIDGAAYLSQELWASVFIALSVCAAARGRRVLSVSAGLFALFYRELTLPYVFVAAFLAWRQRRRGELAGWLVGLGLYAVYLGLHAWAVRQHVLLSDRVPGSWVQFGGAGFLLGTCRMNVFLFSVPAFVRAIYLVLAVLGLFAVRGEAGHRVLFSAGLYLAAFAVVGQPFNDYWGLLYAPLLPFGLVAAPGALRRLFADAFPSRARRGSPNLRARRGSPDPAVSAARPVASPVQ